MATRAGMRVGLTIKPAPRVKAVVTSPAMAKSNRKFVKALAAA
jgi:hypothetical protein